MFGIFHEQFNFFLFMRNPVILIREILSIVDINNNSLNPVKIFAIVNLKPDIFCKNVDNKQCNDFFHENKRLRWGKKYSNVIFVVFVYAVLQ